MKVRVVGYDNDFMSDSLEGHLMPIGTICDTSNDGYRAFDPIGKDGFWEIDGVHKFERVAEAPEYEATPSAKHTFSAAEVKHILDTVTRNRKTCKPADANMMSYLIAVEDIAAAFGFSSEFVRRR